ncbi:CRISPR-associated endonuclease Cas3'' [Streptomyces achromogenes]
MSDEGSARSGLLGRLGGPAQSVWAKYDRDSDGWLPLWRHMEDAAAVAGLLWDRWVSAGVRRLVAEVLPRGDADARALAVWLAGVHDIGKATPAFACQVDQLAETMRQYGLEMCSAKAVGPDRRVAPHGLAGQALLGEWLEERHGWTPARIGQFTVAVGGHHGVPPEHAQISALYEHEELLRTPGASGRRWRQVQTELFDACAERFGVARRLAGWRAVKLPQPVQVLLAALVIVSDWIASNPDLVPYFPTVRPAVTRSVSPRPGRDWTCRRPGGPKETGLNAQELFADRFDLPAGARIRPVQEEAVNLAREMQAPGLMIVEAPMGEGRRRRRWPWRRFSRRARARMVPGRRPRGPAWVPVCSPRPRGWSRPQGGDRGARQLLPAGVGMVPSGGQTPPFSGCVVRGLRYGDHDQ